MQFDKVTKEHILKAIKDFDEKGVPNGFGESSTYDLVLKGNAYPPKAIMAYAFFNATGEYPKNNFSAGDNGECFQVLRKCGFHIKPKNEILELVNVKNDFAQWLLEYAPESYKKNYLGSSINNVEERLNEINSFFPDINFFRININYINEIISVVNFVFGKKERSRHPDFLKYDKEKSSGIPKAIMGKNNYVKFLKELYETEKANSKDHTLNFTWVETHKQIVNYLSDQRSNQKHLIQLLKDAGCDVFNDQDPKDNIIDLEVIDPFTFFCYIYKYGTETRLQILQHIAKAINVNVPTDERGIPSANPQKVWLFPYKYLRLNDEINRLWILFDAALQNSIDEPLFKDALNIKGVATTKLTEAIFYIDPENYFPINGPTKPYLQEVLNINPNFNTFFEYKSILSQIRTKSDKPFYQLSYEARLWSDNQGETNFWVFQGNPKVFDFEAAIADGSLDNFTVSAHKDKIKVGDKVIIWLAGEKAGCYALAEVTAPPHKIEVSPDDKHWKVDNPYDTKAGIKLIYNLFENPVLWEDLKNYKEFKNFKGGNPGSNFTATREEYNLIMNKISNQNKKYWIYSPGQNAEHWDEFYNNGIMAIGWDALGDLNQYRTKNEVYTALKNAYGGDGSKKNNVSANFEFCNQMKIGDVVIVKQGIGKLLGYGEVRSDYYYDENRDSFNSCRKVDWKKKGVWQTDHNLVLKTLTDITDYKQDSEDYDFYYERLLQIMDSNIKSKVVSLMAPKNQILYGPPGTGKTYFLKEYLFESYTIRDNSISQEKFFEETVSGLTWWQVLALALLETGTAKVNTILENRWVTKKANLSESKNVRATLWGTLQMHTIVESKNVAYTQRQAPFIFDKNNDKSWSLLESELKEQSPELYKILDRVNNFKANSGTIIKNYSFVTFHQSFAYEDFIEGIKPIFPETEAEEVADLGYTIEDGVFKQLCIKAKNDPDNKYAIFIDEINRGNVSAIFGELITLIETDKRLGSKNELKIKLPYSKKEFGVPGNLDIYGTMNTADRSVEALDTALRRRFEFKEMMPDLDVIKDEEIEGINLAEVLKRINQRIELLVDRDHTIGHSYFVDVNTKSKLANAFNNKIVPLLQEYFYGDYGKIGLVLGKGFVEKQKNDTVDFADFDYENANDFKTPSFILKKVNEDTVIEAIEVLLGKNEVNQTE